MCPWGARNMGRPITDRRTGSVTGLCDSLPCMRQRRPVACPQDRRTRVPGRRRDRRARPLADCRRSRHDRRDRARRSRHPRCRVAPRSAQPPLSATPTDTAHRHHSTSLPPTHAPPPLPFLSVPVLTLDFSGPLHHLPNPHPVHHQTSFLFGPRPRSRTPMVRGRGRGPNRPLTPVNIGPPQPPPPDLRSGGTSGRRVVSIVNARARRPGPRPRGARQRRVANLLAGVPARTSTSPGGGRRLLASSGPMRAEGLDALAAPRFDESQERIGIQRR
jgi:hypothetical protein